nr:putative reverse transcriptase domain-containing protein [Tanacetum cinerariifolium]
MMHSHWMKCEETNHEITQPIEEIAYKLGFPDKLRGIHDTFHVSNLKRCFVNDDAEPVEIMDREVKRLKQSRILIVKVRWNSRWGTEFTWDGKGMSDDLEEWYDMGDCGTPSSEFMGVSSPLCLSSFVVPWVVDGVGADR